MDQQTIKTAIPDCSKNISRDVIWVFDQMWLSKDTYPQFICSEGNKRVSFMPSLSGMGEYKIGCEGCPFNTAGKEKEL